MQGQRPIQVATGAHCGGRRLVTRAGLCAAHCVTGGALCATRCVPGAGLCATRCVTEQAGVYNALCRRKGLCTTPCVGACACGLVVRATDFLPVTHGLKSERGLCAQRLVSRGGPVRNALCHRGGCLCTTPCVAQRLVSPRGRPCTTPCVTEGACAQRLVSHNAVCRATPWEHLGIHSVSPPAKKIKDGSSENYQHEL